MKHLLLFIIILISLPSFAQKERKVIRKGNSLFSENKFKESEEKYRNAIDLESKSFEAQFNLGDALYKQKRFKDALDVFKGINVDKKHKDKLSKVFYNIGNSFLSQKKNAEAIEAYKEALRNNPKFEQARYNLEWAKQDQKNQDKNKQDKKQQDKENKDKKNQDKKDQKQNKKDQEKKDKKQKDNNKKQQNKQKQKQQKNKGSKDKKSGKNKISKANAKRLLEALQNDEKKVQAKVKKAKAKALKAKKKKIEKDW